MSDKLKAELEALLARRFPSYHEPLRQARRWNRGTADEREAAAELLAELQKRYPTALVVWYEGAFNLANRETREQTLNRLKAIEQKFGGRLNEDTHSLWGRCHKTAGHERLEAALLPTAKPEARAAALEDAERAYLHALEQYNKALVCAATGFPKVNVAFLKFVLAAVAREHGHAKRAEELLEESRNVARELLAGDWQTALPDADVWHPATLGEAHALLGEWDAAALQYERAAAGPSAQLHHRKSMGKQLQRLVAACDLQNMPVSDAIRALAQSLSAEGAK